MQRVALLRFSWAPLLILLFVVVYLVNIEGKSIPKRILGTQTETTSGRDGWEAGTNTDLDTTDTSGDAKIASAGSWGARTWKTPPNYLGLGTTFTTDGTDLYVLRGVGDNKFYKYSPSTNTWTTLKNTPIGAYNGSFIEYGPADTIYAFFGPTSKKFYSYTISTDTWTQLDDLPDTISTGSSMVWAQGILYAVQSQATQNFWRYNPDGAVGDKWSSSSYSLPATISNANSLVYDGNTYIYVLRGVNTTTWYRYNVTTPGNWTTMTTNYPTAINEWTIIEYYSNAIYVQHPNSTTVNKCVISGTNCDGGVWATTPAITTLPVLARYGGFQALGSTLYSFRANSTFDMWKYNPATDKMLGPAMYPQAISTGGDLVYDGTTYVYGLKGGAPANGFYRYDTGAANSWSAALTTTGLPTLSYDTKVAKAGNFIYLFTGNSTAFWAYDTTNDALGWVSKTVAPATVSNGAGLAYDSDVQADYVFATQGNGGLGFYAYSILNNDWTTFNPTDLPAGAAVNIGGRVVATDTRVYALLGGGSSRFFEYNYNGGVGGGTWTEKTRAPFPGYYGTDMTVYNNKIYAQAGYYKNEIYEYNPSTNVWRHLPDYQSQYQYDLGAYQGASIEYMGGSGIMATLGATYTTYSLSSQETLSYTASTDNYLDTASYISPVLDLTYVEDWNPMTISKDEPGGSSVVFSTRTSVDGTTWPEAFADLVADEIQSPAHRRYLQVKATLTPGGANNDDTSVIHSYEVSYETDEGTPTNPDPAHLTAKSQEVGGVDITTATSYTYNHPYFSWPAVGQAGGASDSASGVEGYYVYFGTNAAADPTTDGSYQTTLNYTTTAVLEQEITDDYYLLISTKDKAGKTAAATEMFHYIYGGVSPVSTVTKSSTADFNAGDLTNINTANDQMMLTGKAGFWQEYGLASAPTGLTLGYGASIVYKATQGKFYVARGNNTTTFWSYDPTTDAWATLNSTGLGTIYYGGSVINGPDNYLYAARGGTSNKFYRYDVTNDAAGWSDADAEDACVGCFTYGADFSYDGTRYIYAFKGGDDAFYRFDPNTTADGEWQQKANANFGYPDQTASNSTGNGAAMAYDNDNTIYAIQGALTNGFGKYTISGTGANSWSAITRGLPALPSAGSKLIWDDTQNLLYYLPGNYLMDMFSYDPNTGEWTDQADAPSYFGYGTGAYQLGDYFYILKGTATTTFYKYRISKNSWFLPTNNLFGPSWFNAPQASSSYFGTYYGTDLIKGDGNYYYAMRGYYDNQFTRYDASTGTVSPLAPTPTGSYNGGALVYDEDAGLIYGVFGTTEASKWFKYTISSDSWTEMTADVLPATSTAGASMVYDGARYIYYAPGGSTAWYRYDKSGVSPNKWSTALPTTNLGSLSYGSQLVYKDNYVYVMRGSNVNPNPLYRFKVSDLPESPPWGALSWTVLDSLAAPVYNDAFLVDGGDGYLYGSVSGNNATYGRQWYRYKIDGGGWTRLADWPGYSYVGGAGAPNGSNRIYAFAGAGTDSLPQGLYTFVEQTDNSSFEESGSYTSEAIDLTSTAGKKAYAWGNLTVQYTTALNTTLTAQTQSSDDNITWSALADATKEKILGTNHQFSINSPTARYLKAKISLESSDGILSPVIPQYSVNYYKDLDPPDNPTALSSAKSKSAGGVDITTGHWYNYPVLPDTTGPYFVWPAPGTPGGADDHHGGSGVAGYYLYFGTDSGASPSTARGMATEAGETGLHYQTTLNFNFGADTTGSMVSGQTYYLLVSTKDNAGNTQGAVWQAFEYKYDTIAPTNPSSLVVNPIGYTNIDSYVFTISADAADPVSGLLKYQYRTGADPADTYTDYDPVLGLTVTIPNPGHPTGKYQDGENLFYMRVVDNAGNVSTPKEKSYYFGSAAPSKPQNLTVSLPNPNTVNSFSFSWDAPAAYIGDVNKITYYYSVNAEPTEFNSTSTGYVKAVGTGAYATQWGPNKFYVVAKDEAGNINWTSFEEAIFTANTAAPGTPTSVQVSDISNKEGDEYRLVISWLAPTISDPANFNGYDIYSAGSEGGVYTKIANTSGTAYVHVALVKDSIHYYYIKSIDKTGNASPASSIASATATGRYTKAPDLITNPKVVAKATTAQITWSTSREANSMIEYGLTSALGKAVGNPQSQYYTAHDVTVSNLAAGTTYYYKAVFTDPDGNTGNSEVGSFITAPAPSIAGLKIEDITLSSMLVTWDSNVPSYGQINYGEGAATNMVEKEDAYYTTHHVVKLKDLKSETTYSVQVRAQDAEENSFTSDLYTAQTLALPKVTEVKVENKTEVDTPTMLITYKTNVETSTLIRYTPEGGATKEFVTSDYATDHTAEITDLLPAKPYTLAVTGRDHYGNEAEPNNQQITSLSDTMPPKVLKISERKKVVGQGQSAEAQLTIKLTTNEPSTMVIEASKGIASSDFSIKSNEDPLNTEHTVVTKLGDSTVPYSYRVKLRDASGNETNTEVKTVVLARAQKSALEFIMSIFARSFGWMGEVFK